MVKKKHQHTFRFSKSLHTLLKKERLKTTVHEQ